MAGGAGAGGEERRGPEGAPDNDVRSSVPRKPRSNNIPRAAPSHWLGLKVPVLPPAPPLPPPSPGKCCRHCGITSTPQWRMGPAGARTLCNACGVRYRQRLLVPEYRPWASPSFNELEHSNNRREVLKIRETQDHPEPPAPYQPIRAKRRKGKGKGKAQQPAAQAGKKRKGNQQEHNQQPAEAVLEVGKKISKGKAQMNLPPPPSPLPQAGDNMEIQDTESPPDSPILESMLDVDVWLVKRTSPRQPEKSLPAGGDGMDQMAQHLPPPPPAQPDAAGGEQRMDEPLPPPDPFLFDGPAAPKIIEDDEPVVIVIDDD